MIDLLKRADPAVGIEVDPARLRAKVDEKLHASWPVRPQSPDRPWLRAVVAFVFVITIAIALSALRQEQPSIPQAETLGDLPGIESVVPLASGGVQTMAVDEGTIWVMTAFAQELQRVSAITGQVEASYPIDSYVEGVVVGGGYVWLRSYDNGGEVLRFDPSSGEVDLRIAVGPPALGATWFDGSLWVSNDQNETFEISQDGEIISVGTGEIKGAGLGYRWVYDSETRLITSLAPDGTRGEIVVPTDPLSDPTIRGDFRRLTEADGRLWLMEGDYPWGVDLRIFDPATREFRPFGGLTFGLLDMIEFEGALWVTSHTDHLLMRIDPETDEVHRYPMPGKVGGLAVADGSLWVALYHPGALVRLDPSAGLIESAPVVAEWNGFPHRLLCTGTNRRGGLTVLLEPSEWIDHGSWSVVQAQLSNQGYRVCANGYVEGEATPARRAADLSKALTETRIPGPFVVVASGDGVHATRLFAEGRSDIAGVVLIDPMPVGFQRFFDRETNGADHPPWADLEPSESAALDDFGDAPLVIIGQEPLSAFLAPSFIDAFGEDKAGRINAYWQEGLAFYAGLSTDSRLLTAPDSAMEMLIWNQPDLIVEEVTDLLERVATE